MKQVLLTDVCDIRYGYAFDSALFSDSEGVPLVRIRDVVRGSSETFTTEPFSEDYAVRDGDILIGMDGEFNIAKWRGGNAALNQRVCKMIPKRINEVYLLYFMRKTLKAIEDKTPFVTVKHLSAKELNKIIIPLPTDEEQKEIADTLWKVDELISLRKKQLQKLDDLIKSRFVEMFGDPITNPKQWKVKRFDEICENLDSRRKPITESDRKAGIYPYYGASGIVDYIDDFIYDEDILLISEDGANLIMRSTPIAFSVSGKVWVNNHAHVVRFKKKSVQKYIEVCFSLLDITEFITGSAQPKLNQTKLNSMLFAIPDDEYIEGYFVYLNKINNSKMTIQQGLDKLEQMKQALMQKYFG